jgi:hypothetical protein
VGTPRTGGVATAALRGHAPDLLVAGFAAQVAWLREHGPIDPRDEMLDLAALVDCCRRLGEDAERLLGPTAAAGPEWLATLFSTFVRRQGITLGAFGWSIIDTPEGPAYRFAWPRWTPPERGTAR